MLLQCLGLGSRDLSIDMGLHGILLYSSITPSIALPNIQDIVASN